MDLAVIRQKILTDDEFILNEVKRLQYVYKLKYEIRYGLLRGEKDYTESVAEHVYGMHVITDYFLDLEDEHQALDRTSIREMITWHDVVELQTGDKISWQKTKEDVAKEAVEWKQVIPKLPTHLQRRVYELVEAYETLANDEACFVKAIDKAEPVIHLYNELGKTWCTNAKLTRFDAERIKTPYIKNYPYIRRFVELIHDRMDAEGYFYPET